MGFVMSLVVLVVICCIILISVGIVLIILMIFMILGIVKSYWGKEGLKCWLFRERVLWRMIEGKGFLMVLIYSKLGIVFY